jgi:acyl dehydratase/NAD(P)-dependent dehydrogenase (short-subunit alcohol dehydrogenase family)
MSEPEVRARRTFSPADQRVFATLSQDWNPIHVDALAARRTLFGVPVVHGVHLALWALDVLVGTDVTTGPTRVVANFSKPCFVDDPVDLVVRSRDDRAVRLWLTSRGRMVTDLRVELGGDRSVVMGTPVTASSTGEPKELTLAQTTGRSGELHVGTGPALRSSFPRLCAAIGDVAVAQLAALSRLVGMECPGLHSLFAGFDVIVDAGGATDRLAWRVIRADERFALVRMAVSGGVIDGEVRAFVRPAPARQVSMDVVRDLVEASEFAGSTALVVGGSRGLGELASKVVAAGGAEVVVTYQRGSRDAEAVVADITGAGGRASTLQLDASEPAAALLELAERRIRPTHLLYFASPRIFALREGLFDAALFEGFCAVYLTGFAAILEGCRALGASDIAAFYPSTVAIDEAVPELREYAAAKLAAEQLIEVLNRSQPGIDVVVRRLPRLPTDQTATLGDADEGDPVSTILEAVRATYAARTGEVGTERAAATGR